MGRKAHKALECRGVTRSDFRYDDTQGEPGYYITSRQISQPGLTPFIFSS
jgi:D-alanine-D-alanine ligase